MISTLLTNVAASPLRRAALRSGALALSIALTAIM
jgi:hypothetical protein